MIKQLLAKPSICTDPSGLLQETLRLFKIRTFQKVQVYFISKVLLLTLKHIKSKTDMSCTTLQEMGSIQIPVN